MGWAARQPEPLQRVVGGLRRVSIEAIDRNPLPALGVRDRPLERVGSAYANAPAATGQQINLMQLNLDNGPLRDGTGFYYLWDPTVW